MLNRRVIQLTTIAFLFIGFIFTSTSAFAYWREVTVTRDVELVRIGEPIEILINDITAENAEIRLVPVGYIISEGDVDVVQLQYEVSVSRELLNAVDLYIAVEDILINESDEYSHLIDVSILDFGSNAILDLYNDTITVTVSVRITEPIDMAEAIEKGLDVELVNVDDSVLAYETIKGQLITFSLSFELQTKAELNTDNN